MSVFAWRAGQVHRNWTEGWRHDEACNSIGNSLFRLDMWGECAHSTELSDISTCKLYNCTILSSRRFYPNRKEFQEIFVFFRELRQSARLNHTLFAHFLCTMLMSQKRKKENTQDEITMLFPLWDWKVGQDLQSHFPAQETGASKQNELEPINVSSKHAGCTAVQRIRRSVTQVSDTGNSEVIEAARFPRRWISWSRLTWIHSVCRISFHVFLLFYCLVTTFGHSYCRHVLGFLLSH